MASLAFPIPIDARADHVHCAGDSVITGYDNNAHGSGLLAPIFWRIASLQAAAKGKPSGVGPAVSPGSIAWTQDGIPGTGMHELAANVTTRVLAYHPTVLFLLGSSNEWGSVTWAADADTVVNAVKAQNPNCKVCVISNLFGSGTKWTTASGWGSNPNDGSVASLNSVIKAWADARGDVWYLNLRGDAITDANTFLKYVSQHNTPEPGSAALPSPDGIVDVSGLHPVRAEGQKILCDLLYAYLQVTI